MVCASRVSKVRTSALIAALVLCLAGSASAQRADLARARSLYNQRQFDGAVEAASAAQKTPATADAATVVLARAQLERYRERANPGDLAAARVALGTVRVSNLDARDRVDLQMALGEALFFEDDYGAAATLFESGIEAAMAQGPSTGEAMLEWWGSATERRADALDRDARMVAFRALRERMSRELSRNAASSAAAYWLVVGARGEGEAETAWDAAIAGWVRARLAGARSATLRADLDKLVWKESSRIACTRWPPSGAPQPNPTSAPNGRWSKNGGNNRTKKR